MMKRQLRANFRRYLFSYSFETMPAPPPRGWIHNPNQT